MAAVERFGRHPITGRTMLLLEIDALEDWPEELVLKSPHFVLFLACDAQDVADEDLAAVAGKALEQGMVYLSAWGGDSERVHDVFEATDAEFHPDSTADDVVLSEWHEDEPLAEALRFAVAQASPAADHEKTCKVTLAVSVGNPDWAERIRKWLKHPDLLEKAIEDDEEEPETAEVEAEEDDDELGDEEDEDEEEGDEDGGDDEDDDDEDEGDDADDD
jgi:hypothetical protein